MMHLYTGHPAGLKTAFFDLLKQNKQNPFDKVLVVLPSRRLESSLKKEYAAREGFLSAVYFTDFLQLALAVNNYGGKGNKPLLPNTRKQDFIIKNILQKYGSNHGRGYIEALKSSFRDLAAAQISPRDIVSLKNDETLLTPEQKDDISKIAVFYNDYMEALKTAHYSTYYEVFQSAAELAENSAYLKGFKHILFYGFYDFTALQFDLFKAVNEGFDTAVFFPFEDNPAYKFIKDFYESNVLAKASSITKLPAAHTEMKELADNLFTAAAERANNAPLQIISASGAAAEIEAAAKQILYYKEKLGIDFKDIALTARSMEYYRQDILNILGRNLIPCRAALEAPLTETPLASFILNLFNLAKNNFYRDDVLAVITSPYFAGRNNGWQSIVKNIGITAGYAQWMDLLPLSPHKEEARKIAVFLEEIKNLLARVSAAAPFGELADAALYIIEKYTIPQEQLEHAEKAALAEVYGLLKQIRTFAEVRPNAEEGEFTEEFCALVKEHKISLPSPMDEGVEVSDIMSLRGQDFKAVIILGLNEGLLPAAAKEDPVLKDVYRRLFQKLGFLIHKQADRYEEEKILFYFILSAAREQITLIYQRSGEDGKPKIPSLYLTQILTLLGQDLGQNSISVLPRRPEEKYKQWPAEFLNRNEAALLAALCADDKTAVISKIKQAGNDEETRFQAAQALNGALTLTPYDGVINKGNTPAAQLKTRGISPSDMMVLFKCPARFLFDKITRKEEERPFERGALAPLAKGTLYHQILEDFYKHIKQNKQADKLFAQGAKDILKQFTGIHLAADNYKKYGIYPVMWDVLRAEMERNLNHFIEEDLKLMQEGSFTPAMFEEKIETEIQLNKTSLKLRGKLDRIDISADGKNYRIIDYKSKKENAEIKRAVFEKAVLQPPLYFEMARNHPALQNKAATCASLLGIEAEGSVNRDLSFELYQSFRKDFIEMIEYLAQLVEHGIFIINPSDNSCLNCRFESLCRKAHRGTLRRAKASPHAKKLREYHAK